MKFPEAKIVIWGRYCVTPLGLERDLSVIPDNHITIEKAFELKASSARYISAHKDKLQKCRKFDIMAIVDNTFIWYRYRGNNKAPILKYRHIFKDDEKYIFIATPDERNEYTFDTNYNNLINRLCRKNGKYQILRISKEYMLPSEVLDDYNTRPDEYDAIVQRVKEASKISLSAFYDEIMKYVASETNWITVADGKITEFKSVWDIGDVIYRSYKDFETLDKCKAFIDDPYLIFDSDYSCEDL